MRSKFYRLLPRVSFAAAAYWAANAALAMGELRWHILSRLVAFDLLAAEMIPALVVGKVLHVGISIALATLS